MTGSLIFKGMVDSVKDLVFMDNPTVGDVYVTKYDGNAYIWSGSQWQRLDHSNIMRIVRMDYPNVEKETSDFESNLKKLEEKAFELQQREKYYGGHSNLNNIDAECLTSVIKPVEICDGDTISSCIKDIYNKSNVEIPLDGSIGSSVEDEYIDAVYDSWNTALAESGK